MEEQPTTNAGKQFVDMCQLLIKKREMKNARTYEDYCFWMHHDTAADLLQELTKHQRMSGITMSAFGLPIYLDSKMEHGEISCVKRASPPTN